MGQDIRGINAIQPKTDYIHIVANGIKLKTFAAQCPLMPADNVLTEKLTELSDLFLAIYREEWGEKELPDNTFWGILESLDSNDVISLLTTDTEDSQSLELMGISIATHVSLDEMLEKMNVIITPTTGQALGRRDLPEYLPTNLVYFDEIFVHQKAREGVGPFVSLVHSLTKELLKKYDAKTPVAFFTKGHRLENTAAMFSVMNFATQIGMYRISQKRIEDHDRFVFWIPLQTLANTFLPPFTKQNLGDRIHEARAFLDATHPRQHFR